MRIVGGLEALPEAAAERAVVDGAAHLEACSAAVSRLASSSRSPKSARPTSSPRSMWATSVSVATPGSSSATSFTRHTGFGTGPRLPREPGSYRSRTKPHRVARSQWGLYGPVWVY
jgi:hypothetical protein